MSAYMGNLAIILEKCQQAAEGELTEDEQAALASRVKGVFMSMHMFNGVVRAAEARDWHTVEGALANYIDVQETAGHGTSVTQNANPIIDARSENVNTANASATALATASFGEACAAVDELDLDDDEKAALFDLLNDVRKAKGDEPLAKKAVSRLLENAVDYGFDAFAAVMPYVWGVAMSFIRL